MKTIKIFLSNTKRIYPIEKGSYGTYYQLTAFKGVKVVKTKQEAIEEATLLKTANIVDFTPKCFGLAEVYFKGNKRTHFGILQEHITGKIDSVSQSVQNKLRAELEQKTGINHCDLANPNNIITTPKSKHYVIDFTPSWVSAR